MSQGDTPPVQRRFCDLDDGCRSVYLEAEVERLRAALQQIADEPTERGLKLIARAALRSQTGLTES